MPKTEAGLPATASTQIEAARDGTPLRVFHRSVGQGGSISTPKGGTAWTHPLEDRVTCPVPACSGRRVKKAAGTGDAYRALSESLAERAGSSPGRPDGHGKRSAVDRTSEP